MLHLVRRARHALKGGDRRILLFWCQFYHTELCYFVQEKRNKVFLCIDALYPSHATALSFWPHNSLLKYLINLRDLLVDGQIQNRLGNAIPSMQKDLSLPDGKPSQLRMTQRHWQHTRGGTRKRLFCIPVPHRHCDSSQKWGSLRQGLG